jgi:D-glycero-alpha-D-manno-heptose 1-phosphate guanylyltransferase
MEVVVLCGGKGTRVRGITQDKIPKILIPINGRPFISYLIDVLLMNGKRDIYFSAGHLADSIQDYLDNNLTVIQKNFGNYLVVKEPEPMGTGGGLLYTNLHVKYDSGAKLLVVNGDTLLLARMHKFYRSQGFRVVLHGVKTVSDGSYGLIKTGRSLGQSLLSVKSFDEKMQGVGYINCGWYKFHPDMLKNEEVRPCSLEYDLIPKWVNEADSILEPFDETDFVEIGTQGAIDRAELILR